jgi:hypothetical protein
VSAAQTGEVAARWHWLPDPAAGRRLRALAIGLVIACAATCARGSDPSGHAAARRIVARE